MPARKIGKKWWVDVWIDVPEEGRRRFRRRSPFRTKKETEAFERDLIEDVLSTSRQSEQEEEAEEMPPERRYRDYAVEFLKTYAVTNNKHSEVMTKESILRVHLIPAFGRMLLEEIRPAVIERFKAEKLESGLKPKTINNTLTVLRKSLVVAQEWGYLENVPPIRWMKTAKPSFDFLDFEEAARLVKAAEPEWQPLIILAMKTGLRMGELRALRWEDVDLVSRRLMVRQAVSRGKIGTPKSNRQRWLPLCNSAVEGLKVQRHLRGELVFCKDDGSMITKNEMKSPLWRACRKAGLRLIGWHCLRHTFASHLVMTGVPLKAVQELLGHSTIDMTMRYAHLSPDVTREAVGRLDGIDGIGGNPQWGSQGASWGGPGGDGGQGWAGPGAPGYGVPGHGAPGPGTPAAGSPMGGLAGLGQPGQVVPLQRRQGGGGGQGGQVG